MKINISDNGRHFVTADNEPFFWLADTAWNAPLRGDTGDWVRYLDLRAKQGFSAIQFVTSPWRGRRTPVHGRLFEVVDDNLVYDESAFEKMREWFGLICDRGMIPAPVMIWDNNPDDPFFRWSIEACIEVGRRMIDEWSCFDPVWILAGDGDYRKPSSQDRWKSIGKGVFSEISDAVATMHPCGLTWVGDSFADEPWYSFVGIQSGHGSVDYDLNFLVNGPYSYRWQNIRKPFINLEPNYELARSYKERVALTDYHVRRAAYWSLFVAPTAGLTYGNNNIWTWAQTDNEEAEGHGSAWVSGKWIDGLETAGTENLGVMRSILEGFGWADLMPATHLLALQPGWADPNEFISCARKADGSLVAAYLPKGGSVRFIGALDSAGMDATWIDPRTGESAAADYDVDSGADAPDGRDWLLVLEL